MINSVRESMEVELKLILPSAEAEKAIIDFLRQNRYRAEKAKLLKLTDIYMDTSDWALLRHKLSLRYRLADKTSIYTVKSVGSIEDGIARRMETETILKKPARAPTEIPVKQIRTMVDEVIFPRKLLEQVLIRTNRQLYLVTAPDGAVFEVAFDESNFFSNALFEPRRNVELYQMEAEITSGAPVSLVQMQKLIVEQFGYIPATSSKLMTAMEHLKVEPLIKKVPESLKVTLDDRLDAALKKILSAEFSWFKKQLPGIISDRDPEFVHQGRVATRRMRSALILFHKAITPKDALYFENRLKWLGKLFGNVRDLDVFIINLTRFKDRLESCPKNKKEAMENLVIKERRPYLKELNSALTSRRYKNFEKRLDQFLRLSPTETPAAGLDLRVIREAAPPAVLQRFNNVVEQSRKTLSDPRLCEYHCLRIQMKRLRYAFEFMAPPYGDVFNDIIKSTTEIQDCLGELQDTVFNQKLVKKLLKEWQGKIFDGDLVFLLGEIYQIQGQIARERQETFTELWNRFAPSRSHDEMKRVFEENLPAGVN